MAGMLFGLTIGAAIGPALAQGGGDKSDRWYGTIKGHGQGNIYNDTAEVSFEFREEADGTIKGTGRAKVTSEEQSFANCRISRKPADPFDFPIGGRRVGDEFQLELTNPRMPVVFSYSGCPGGAPKTTSVNTSGFLGAGAGLAFLKPTVQAKDGATNELHSQTGDLKVDVTIEIHHCPPWVTKVAADELSGGGQFAPATPGDIAPNCDKCSDPWELIAVDVDQQTHQKVNPSKCFLYIKGKSESAWFCFSPFQSAIDISCQYTYKAIWQCPTTREILRTRKSKTESGACPTISEVAR